MEKKAEHTYIRNSKLFCSHCGSYQTIPFPIAIPMLTAMGTAFSKMHRDCSPVWKEPETNEAMSIQQKAELWLNHGERGASSETMFQTISGMNIGSYGSHPYDAGDFRRCYGLLKMVPEWKNEIHKMKTVSKQWANLTDNWDELTQMLEQEMTIKKSIGLSKRIQQLIA